MNPKRPTLDATLLLTTVGVGVRVLAVTSPLP